MQDGDRQMQGRSSEELAATELVQRSIDDSRELVRLELALAKDELLQDLRSARTAAILGGVAMVLSFMALASFTVAVGVLLGPLVVGGVGLALLIGAGTCGFIAFRRIPLTPMASTLRRLETDKRSIAEHLS
jgi:uncharacterized membrane protein YqjE